MQRIHGVLGTLVAACLVFAYLTGFLRVDQSPDIIRKITVFQDDRALRVRQIRPNVDEIREDPPPQNWPILYRINDERSLMCSASPPWPVRRGEPRGFALLFLTMRNIVPRLVWERWLRDAYQWIHQQGLEDPKVLPHQSQILRTFVHYQNVFEHNKVQDLMTPTMQESPIMDSTNCTWSTARFCLQRGLEHIYEVWPEAGYFNVLSHNSIPLKPFSHMYNEFLTNKKIRTAIASFCYDEETFVPKSPTWKSMPREVVRPIIERPAWLKLPGLRHGAAGGVPEEGQMWHPVMEEYGEQFAALFHPGNMAGKPPPWSRDTPYFHHDCWRDSGAYCEALAREFHDVPWSFSKVDGDTLRLMMKDPHMWFIRKVSDETVVLESARNVSRNQSQNTIHQDHEASLPDFLFKEWGSTFASLQIEDHPALHESIEYPKGGVDDIGEMLPAWREAGLFGLRES
eukprot:Blabericola_migrator_1__12184@NODE_755_length_6648_cov_53_314086_g541_i0_p2_GENE_NODE_755_length_6648_cov_53_314086_g541_i0NODE_755_length_6648_cov_53_314086_g541_i0_p2_ORF_typecomplete_len456_score66_28Branch/PF02485_21/0_00089_NODE_755_length_6648_cov_53_314086_g541_i034764843